MSQKHLCTKDLVQLGKLETLLHAFIPLQSKIFVTHIDDTNN